MYLIFYYNYYNNAKYCFYDYKLLPYTTVTVFFACSKYELMYERKQVSYSSALLQFLSSMLIRSHTESINP